MFDVDFSIGQRALKIAERALAGIPGALAKAAERSINKTLKKTRTEWARAMRDEYVIKSSQAKQALVVHRALAARNRLYGDVEGRGRRMELIVFSSNKKPWSQYKNKPRVGATVQVRRQGFKGKIPGTFVERGRKTGKLHLMWRKREGGHVAPREARVLYGPSTADMAEATAPSISPAMSRYFRRRFSHEVRWILSRGKIGTYQGGKH